MRFLFSVSLVIVLVHGPLFQVANAQVHGQPSSKGAFGNCDSCESVDLLHARICENEPFPSAKKCAVCHPKHYREWSVSPHAYAQMSPVFNAMSNTLIKKTSGTLGDLCIRCHTPVGMAMSEPIGISNMQRHPTSREGVTCVVCHRINQAWGKGAGRQSLVAGNINQIVIGPKGNRGVANVLRQPDKYGVLDTGRNQAERSRDIHKKSIRFFQQTTSGFCGTCHDVFAPNGFRLEDAFSEFKASPAARKLGLNCQDCHMGKVPGQAKGYDCGPAAIVGNTETPHRKITNHMMAGPDHSIIHPGLFPHHLTAIREEWEDESKGFATMRDWLLFDVDGGWGTTRFEEHYAGKVNNFPSPWDDPLKRKKGRLIINEQQTLINESTQQRLQVLRAGYHLGKINVTTANLNEIQFEVPVSNITPGHGVPTGFDAERVVFLRTLVWDSCGKLVFQSGDLDPNGDVRDSHSRYVHNGKIPLDPYLFSLQSRFITRNIRGGEREQVLNIPYSIDPLPYVRPATRPFTVLGRTIGARKHKQNIETGGSRIAKYKVSQNQLRGCGPYTVRVQLIAGMVPVNLVHEISGAGFDYYMSAQKIANEIVEGHLVLYERTTLIKLKTR